MAFHDITLPVSLGLRLHANRWRARIQLEFCRMLEGLRGFLASVQGMFQASFYGLDRVLGLGVA